MRFEVPERIGNAVPDSGRVARIGRAFAESAAPVRPLPSNAVIMLLSTCVFVVLAILFAAPFGFPGFNIMSGSGRAIDYTTISLLAMVLAGSVVEQMIPGSRRVMRPWVGALVAILLLSLIAFIQFPDSATRDFVNSGIPCLRLGLLCAIPAGALTWVLMRCGFVTDPVSAGIAGGVLSGLLGVAVLALHCPIFNATHIIAWHAGVIAVTSLAGALLGRGAARYRE